MYCFVYIIYIFIGWVVEEVYVILCGFYELCCIKFRVICVVFFYYVIDFVKNGLVVFIGFKKDDW